MIQIHSSRFSIGDSRLRGNDLFFSRKFLLTQFLPEKKLEELQDYNSLRKSSGGIARLYFLAEKKMEELQDYISSRKKNWRNCKITIPCESHPEEMQVCFLLAEENRGEGAAARGVNRDWY
jgi:hypothetical protein